MNADTAKITDEETDARRRLLLDQVRRLSSEDELDQYLSDIQALIHVPDALIAEANDAYYTAQADREDYDASNIDDDNDRRASAAYRILRLVGDESFDQALDDMSRIIDLTDNQILAIVSARENERSWVNNPYTSSQPANTNQQQQQQQQQQKDNAFTKMLDAQKKAAEAEKQKGNKGIKRGRPKGGTNQPGHNAGGAGLRKAINY